MNILEEIRRPPKLSHRSSFIEGFKEADRTDVARSESLPVLTRRITWDEAVIAEHDKLRGTRMKIDEPDTPFAYGGDDGLEEASDDDGTGEADISAVVGGQKRSEDAPAAEPGPRSSQPLPPHALRGLDFGALEGKLAAVAAEAEKGELFTGNDKAESDVAAKEKAFKVPKVSRRRR